MVPLSQKTAQSYRKRTYSLPVEQEHNFTAYTALFGILENEKELLNIASFSISSPTLEDIFLAITFEADSQPDNIIRRKTGKNTVAPKVSFSSALLFSISFFSFLAAPSNSRGLAVGQSVGLLVGLSVGLSVGRLCEKVSFCLPT